MIDKLIALPYELARLPIGIVDKAVSGTLPADSLPRTTFDRALGSADKVAGTVLRNHDLAARGADRLDRAERLRTAAQLEDLAGNARQDADEKSAAAQQEAARKRSAAADRVTSGLREADKVEARGKQQAQAKASKAASQKQAAAEQRAESRAASAEQRKDSVESAAQGKKKAALRDAKSELDEAREDKQAATETRGDAERLSDLAEAKQEQRKQD